MSSFTETLTLLGIEAKTDWRSLEQGCPRLWCHNIAWLEIVWLTEKLKAREEGKPRSAESWEDRGIR